MIVSCLYLFLTILGSLEVFASPQKITSLHYPATFSETSISSPILIGSSNIKIDLQKSDLELVVWRTQNTYALEINIDVRNVNQSILPTDVHGKLLPKVTNLSAVPWVKVYWPKHPVQTLDVICDSKKKICQSLWKNFPYDPNFAGSIKIEANVRGLEGKIWSPQIYSIRPLLLSDFSTTIESALIAAPYALPALKDSPALGAQLEVTQFYDLLRFPQIFSKLRLLSVNTWKFINDTQTKSSGFFRVTRKTLLQWIQGQSLLEILSQDTVQTFEVYKGQNLWIQDPLILSLSSRSLSQNNETFLRVLEFEEQH